jgi:hypothetical protein
MLSPRRNAFVPESARMTRPITLSFFFAFYILGRETDYGAFALFYIKPNDVADNSCCRSVKR